MIAVMPISVMPLFCADAAIWKHTQRPRNSYCVSLFQMAFFFTTVSPNADYLFSQLRGGIKAPTRDWKSSFSARRRRFS